MKKLGILFAIGFMASAGAAEAATYYVSTTGNNGNSCAQAQSSGTPRQTLTSALTCLGAGDTLLVRGGSYDEGINNNVPSGTSWSNPVRIAAFPGESVWLRPAVQGRNNNGYVVFFGGAAGVNPQYIEFDGINLDDTRMPYGAVRFDEYAGANPNHIRFRNLEVSEGANGGCAAFCIGTNDNEFLNLTVHGGGVPGGGFPNGASAGFYFGGDRNVIDGADIYDTSLEAVQFYNGGGGSADDNVVRNSRIHDLSRSSDGRIWGVIVTGNNNQVYNNLIYNINYAYSSSNAGVYVYTGSGTKIYNNTIYNNSTDGIFVYSAASNVDIKNNIVYANAGQALVSQGSGTVESNNLLNVDPSFVNAGAGNFQLQPNSRAIDAGVAVSIVGTDIFGVARPQGGKPDIGAFEYRSGQSSPSSSTPSASPVAQPAQVPAPPSGVKVLSN